MLLPALSKARQRAISAKCLSNCKQLTLAAAMYIDDNAGYVPGSAMDNATESSTTDSFAYKLYNYLKSYEVFHCAADKTKRVNGYSPLSYGVNQYFEKDWETKHTTSWKWWYWWIGGRPASFATNGSVALFVCRVNGPTQAYNACLYSDTFGWSKTTDITGYARGHYPPRLKDHHNHNGGTNFGRLDGSAGWHTFKEYEVYWDPPQGDKNMAHAKRIWSPQPERAK